MQSRKSNKLLEEFFSCPICLDVMENPITTKCGHNFCHDCMKKNNYECAVCRTPLLQTEIALNYQLNKTIEVMRSMEEEELKKRYFNIGGDREQLNNLKTTSNGVNYNMTNNFNRQRNSTSKRQSSFQNTNSSLSINPVGSNFNFNINYSSQIGPTNKYRIKRTFSMINCFSEISNSNNKNNNYPIHPDHPNTSLNNYSSNYNRPINNSGQNYSLNNFIGQNSLQQSSIKFNMSNSNGIESFLDNIMLDFKLDPTAYLNSLPKSTNQSNFTGINPSESQSLPTHNNFNNININVYNVVDRGSNTNNDINAGYSNGNNPHSQSVPEPNFHDYYKARKFFKYQ